MYYSDGDGDDDDDDDDNNHSLVESLKWSIEHLRD